MIKPTKYTSLDLSVLGLSAEILKILIPEKTLKYSQVIGKIAQKKGEESKQNFLLALSFLYMLGKIEYYPEEDVIQLIPVTQ